MKKKLPYGFLDRFSLILFQLLLLVLSIVITALSIASSEGFYRAQFEKNGIYSHLNEYGNEVRTPIYYIDGKEDNVAFFSDEQIDAVVDHIVGYFFGERDTFRLVMDDVNLNGVERDGVSIFSKKAVSHMRDVKVLFRALEVFAWVGCPLLLLLIAYFVWRRRQILPRLLKYFLWFYGILFAIAGLFCLITLITKESDKVYLWALWMNLHQLFFLFNPDKVAGSVLIDATTELLSLPFFMTCIKVVVTVLLSILLLQLVVLLVLKRLFPKRRSYDTQSINPQGDQRPIGADRSTDR